MSEQFTVLFYDALTGTALDTIPTGKLSFGSQINQPKSLSGQFNSTDPAMRQLDIWGATKPARTIVCVDYNGTLVWGGITIGPRQFTLSQKEQVALQANELWSYFTRRQLPTDYGAPPYSGIYPVGGGVPMPIWNARNTGGSPPNAWDPVLMAAQVISDAMRYANVENGGSTISYGTLLGGIPIFANGFQIYNASAPVGPNSTGLTNYAASANATPSANFINWTTPWTGLQTVDSVVTQLANLGVGTGYDFAIDLAYSAGPGSFPTAVLNVNTPTRGRDYTTTNLVVDTANCYDYTVTEDGSQAAWQIYERGGSGAITVAINVFSQQAGYPLLESVQDHSFITSGNITQVLTAIGTSDLYMYSFPPVTFEVKLDPTDPACPLGAFVTGDQVWLTVQPDERFPNGLQGAWRIVGFQVDAPDFGAATMTLTLAQPPVVTAVGPAV